MEGGREGREGGREEQAKSMCECKKLPQTNLVNFEVLFTNTHASWPCLETHLVCKTSFWERLLLSNLCGEMHIAICTPHNHEILDHLLPEVVVNSVDLFLLKEAGEMLTQLRRTGRVLPKRLLHYHPTPPTEDTVLIFLTHLTIIIILLFVNIHTSISAY